MKRKQIITLVTLILALTLSACSKTRQDVSADNTSVVTTEIVSDSTSVATSQIATDTSEVVEVNIPSGIALTNEQVTQMLPNFKNLEHLSTSESAPVVYFTKDISSEGLLAAYKALGKVPNGNVAVKLHTGEGSESYYLRPEFIKALIDEVNGTIVECNTAYPGKRMNTALHTQVAKDRGYTEIANVDIMDSEGEMEIPVTNGTHLKTNIVGSHFANYDFFIVLSHFKGHEMGGFGGALKNTSIGIAAAHKGKSLIHTGGKTEIGIGLFTAPEIFTESMAEAAKSVYDYLGNGENILFINVMNNISIDCDCIADPAAPDMHDIGILVSNDPVALDQACVDLIYAAPDGENVIKRIESRTGSHVLEHAEKIGFGSREYRLITIDEQGK